MPLVHKLLIALVLILPGGFALAPALFLWLRKRQQGDAAARMDESAEGGRSWWPVELWSSQVQHLALPATDRPSHTPEA